MFIELSEITRAILRAIARYPNSKESDLSASLLIDSRSLECGLSELQAHGLIVIENKGGSATFCITLQGREALS